MPAFAVRLSPDAVVPIALGLLLVFAAGDYVTNVEVTFTLLYLVPVCLGAWFRDQRFGLVVALLATAAGVGTTVIRSGPPPSFWLTVWNEGGVLVVFTVIVVATSRLKTYVDREHRERLFVLEQLRHASRLNLIGELAAGVAHEIGTPLNVIAGSAEILRELEPSRGAAEEERAQRQALLLTIEEQSRRITGILRQLLDFGRRSHLSSLTIDVGQVARDTAALLRATLSKRSATLRLDLHPEPLLVLGNAAEIAQVLSNLLLNAVQAMPEGGEATLRTAVVERRDGGGRLHRFASIVVEDEGIGIASDDLPHVFDPFFTTKDVGEGTGLGLSISYGIVRDHEGVIEVAPRTGRGERGTRFTVLLPAVPVQRSRT